MADHPNTFHLVIASVGSTLFDGAAVSVTVPGEAGQFTMLFGHEPIVSTLKKGNITVKTTAGTETFAIESGLLECSGSRVVVLL